MKKSQGKSIYSTNSKWTLISVSKSSPTTTATSALVTFLVQIEWNVLMLDHVLDLATHRDAEQDDKVDE